jgi:hypothetical protein
MMTIIILSTQIECNALVRAIDLLLIYKTAYKDS